MSGIAAGDGLTNKKVLIVEDEALIAMTLQDMLEDLGCLVVARAMTVDQALRCLDGPHFDVAILDVNVAGKAIDPFSHELAARGIPFVIATGYSDMDTSTRVEGRPMLQKPYNQDDLRLALLRAASGS
jgi:DNA-binding NtrC family response regulator